MWELHNGFWDFVVMFALWMLLITLVYYAMRGVMEPHGSGSATRSPAEDVLDERYARGEISEEEYRERRDTLRGAPSRNQERKA